MQRNGKLAAPISNTRTSDGFPGEHRKIGFCLWELKNHPNPEAFETTGVYDPAVRDAGNIIKFDPPDGLHWHGIYLNETKLYPFHKNLYKFDWSSR